MTRDLVAEYYKRHHAGETGMHRYGFTIGGDQRVAWVKERVGSGKDLLDIGCRDGTLSAGYAADNRVTGVDVDDEALAAAARQHGFRTVRTNLNLEPLPFADASFDVVVAGEVIEHLQFPDLAVAEFARVLRTNGLLIGSVPNAFRLRNRLKFLMGQEFENDPTHLHSFSPAAIRRLLAAFRGVEIGFLGNRFPRLPPRLMAPTMTFVGHK